MKASRVGGGVIGALALGVVACGSSGDPRSSAAGGVGAAAAGNGAADGGATLGSAGRAANAGGATAGGGTAGTATVTNAHCGPGQSLKYPFMGSSQLSCLGASYHDLWELGIPNGDAASATGYVLPAPLVAGATNAFSFDVSGNAPDNYEIWGSYSGCDDAQELLWWAPTAVGVFCAEFAPSKAYTHLMFIYRTMHAVSNYAGGGTTVTLCPGGTCPSGTSGEGKAPGTTLTAPLGNYSLNRIDEFQGGWDMTVGKLGNMTVTSLENRQSAGTPQVLSAGVFRMPSTDPYGDAWYCLGAGSTFTKVNENGSLSHVNFSLRGITRLGNCASATGTDALSATMANGLADVTGTVTPWLGNQLSALNFRCENTSCYFRFTGSMQDQFVYLKNSGDTGNYSSPTHATVPIIEASWFIQADRTQPLQLVCATAGSLVYEPAQGATTNFELTNVSSPMACPGTPIANDQWDFVADW